MTEREGYIYLYQKSSCGSNQASEWRWCYLWPLSNARWCEGERAGVKILQHSRPTQTLSNTIP